jgi:hypothetical protein
MKIRPPLAEVPTFAAAAGALAQYEIAHRSKLSEHDRETLIEVSRRIERLDELAADLIRINNRLWDKHSVDAGFDPVSGECTFNGLRMKVNPSDPTRPMQGATMVTSSGYHAGKHAPRDAEEGELRREMEQLLEGFYQSAHRIIKLLKGVPGLNDISCSEIARVRNKLIEHADKGSIYSFGVGSNGPRIATITRGPSKVSDIGFVPNAEAFVKAIVGACSTSSIDSMSPPDGQKMSA